MIKKDDETVGANTVVSGLTNVSPQTQASTVTGVWSTPLQVDLVIQSPTTINVSSTLKSTYPEVTRLEQESKRQRQTISSMEAQIKSLQQLVQELVEFKTQKQSTQDKILGRS